MDRFDEMRAKGGAGGSGGGSFDVGRKITVEAISDINANAVFVGTKNESFAPKVVSSTLGVTFIALSQDERVGVTAQTINSTVPTFVLWFLNENGLYDAFSIPMSVAKSYTMNTTTTHINQDGTLIVIGTTNSSAGYKGDLLKIDVDVENKTATFTEISDFFTTNLTTEFTDNGSTTVLKTYGDVYAGHMSTGFRLAGDKITFMQSVDYTTETTTISTGAVTTSSGTEYKEATYVLEGSNARLVNEIARSSTYNMYRKYSDDTVFWLDDKHYFVFERNDLGDTTGVTNGAREATCYIHKYEVTSGADKVLGTYTSTGWGTSSDISYQYFRHCRFSPNGEYACISGLPRSSKNSTSMYRVHRLDKNSFTSTLIANFNLSGNKSVGSPANDGATLQCGGFIYKIPREGATSVNTFISSGAQSPINRLFKQDRWVSSTNVLHISPVDENAEYYISETIPGTAESGKAYGVCAQPLLAGQKGEANLIMEVS